MKKLLLALLITSFHHSFASKGADGIWLDGLAIKDVTESKYNTLFFGEWTPNISKYLEDDRYFVAIQLDLHLDPLPADAIKLPSLASLAAIENAELRKDYYQFLESFGRTYGFSHMVLPNIAPLNSLQQQVITEMHMHAPYYFLKYEYLSYTAPQSKRMYKEEVASQPIIWVTSGAEGMHDKLVKWTEKLADEAMLSFYESLNRVRKEQFLPAYRIHENLDRAIFESAVVAIDPAHRLPLTTSEICYLGTDSELKYHLSKYASITAYRKEGIPTIVDNRSATYAVEAGDLVLSGSEAAVSFGLLVPKNYPDYQHVILTQMLFGAKAIVGTDSKNESKVVPNLAYLGYSEPQLEGLNANHLAWMDSLATYAIKKRATPGIQVAVVKNGQLVAQRAYGYYTYDSLKKVNNETIYDVASLTKVAATLPAVALLIDQGQIHLDDSISQYLPSFTRSNKSGITIRQLLAHQAGLPSYVPFWSMMMDGDRLDPFYYKSAEDEANDVRTYGISPHPAMVDSLKQFIVRSKLAREINQYKYSDLGFMILHLLVEEVSGLSFEEFTAKHFIYPMGLTHTMFNPKTKHLPLEMIAPTEYDQRYRNAQVWGEVHDRNAAVFGGVAGHAGLFSTATDLAKIMTMFMNNGYYGGKRYLSEEVLSEFNGRHFANNRRGLGWDKKDRDQSAASAMASDESYGHTGFTGTMVWADPKNELTFVFLSNRIYPDATNWKIAELNTRTRMHDILYQALDYEVRRN